MYHQRHAEFRKAPVKLHLTRLLPLFPLNLRNRLSQLRHCLMRFPCKLALHPNLVAILVEQKRKRQACQR